MTQEAQHGAAPVGPRRARGTRGLALLAFAAVGALVGVGLVGAPLATVGPTLGARAAFAAPDGPPPPLPPPLPPPGRRNDPAPPSPAPAPRGVPAAPAAPAAPPAPPPVAPPAPAAPPTAPVPPAPAPVAPPAPPAPPAPAPSPARAPVVVRDARPVLRRITFVGNSAYASESVKLKLLLKEGRPFDPSLLDLDIETLYQFFDRVDIEVSETPGAVELTFNVVENPVVRDLVIHGLEAIKREELEALPLRTRVGFPRVQRNVDLDREDIAAAYRRRGYAFATVGNPVLEETLVEGGLRIVFTVVEGPQVKVDDVVVRGNASIPRRTLLDAMLTKPSKFLSSTYFNEETLREDVVELRRVYRAAGFLDAEVVLEDLRFADDKSAVVVLLAVVEGERYTVGEVRFDLRRQESGPGSPTAEDRAYFTQETLRGLLGLETGAVYDGKAEEKGRDRIREAYFQRSYLEAQVEKAELLPRAGARAVDVVVVVKEGLKYRGARVLVVGNEFTRDKIVRREIPVAPGDYVDRNALDRGLSRVRGLRFFERVSRRFEDVPGPDGEPLPAQKDIVYEVVEGKTGKLNIGGAVSDSGGLSANVQFLKKNFDIARPPTSWDDLSSGRAFTGAGQSLDVYLQPGTVVSSFGVDFGEPRLFGSRFGLRVGASKRIGIRESYREDIAGYYVRLSHPLYESDDDRLRIDGGLTWRHEQRTIRDVRSRAVPGVFLFEGDREMRSLSAYVSLRRVDDPLRPADRFSASLNVEHVGGLLGGELDYWRVDLNADQRWRVHEDELGRRSWLTVNFRGGVADAFGDTPEVPPYSRYYAGGRDTLRGFEYRGVGPHSNDRPMGGEFLLAGSVQYERPLLEEILSVVGFVDAGTISTSIADGVDPLRLAAGAGIRLKIPGIFSETPIAVDFAIPLRKEDEDQTRIVSFSLTRDF